MGTTKKARGLPDDSISLPDLEIQTTNRLGELLHIDGFNPGAGTPRDMTLLETISASWIICNSWAGIAATISLAITLGGPAILIYGPIVVFVLVGCCAVTLAELASVYPTAGGQYHWTSILAPKKVSRGLSYFCGIANVFSWITISAGITIIAPQIVFAMVIAFDENYVAEPWHTFLVYQGLNLVVLLYNIFLLHRTLWIHNLAFVVSILSFFAIIITCAARATTFQPSTFVWGTLLNSSGWQSDTVAFLIGLVSPNYMYAGIDGALHLAEECANAAVVVPRAMMSTVTIGFVTSFAFMITMIYCIQDFDAVLSTPTGVPIYELWRQATASDAAATLFLCLLLLAVVFALNGAQQTASRLTWSLARDDALWGSGVLLPRRAGTSAVPARALIANAAVVFAVGCVRLGSASAFDAIVGAGLALQHVTYAVPAGLVLALRCRPRHAGEDGGAETVLPPDRSFALPGLMGCVANAVTVAVALFALVFYNMPNVMPATTGDMNYGAVVLAGMVVVGWVNWFVHARSRFHGPRLDRVD